MQSQASSTRSTRLEARVSPVQKALFQQAAALTGRTLSDLIVESTQQAANRIVREHEVIHLSREAQIAFVQALLNPRPLPDRLIQAAQDYQQALAERT